MAAVDSPRRILGERDVNKALITKPSSTTSSPSKLGSFSTNNVLNEETLGLGKLARALLSPKLQEASPYPASVDSLSGSKKRGTAWLEDVQDGPPRKQVVVGMSQDIGDSIQPRTVDCETRSQSGVYDSSVDMAPTEAVAGHECLRLSASPDSSFDATQDSELLDSQMTTITEPEDPVPPALPALMIAPPIVLRVVSQEEARENAEALRLRLKFAMYKVETNQTDLPFARLQIRPSRAQLLRSQQSTRTLLPASRSAPEPHHNKPVTPTSHDRDIEAKDHTSILPPSVTPALRPDRSGSHVQNTIPSDFATPILPRSRDGSSHLDSRGSPEPGPEATSSIVKGRAADGLLSLMAGGPRHT